MLPVTDLRVWRCTSTSGRIYMGGPTSITWRKYHQISAWYARRFLIWCRRQVMQCSVLTCTQVTPSSASEEAPVRSSLSRVKAQKSPGTGNSENKSQFNKLLCKVWSQQSFETGKSFWFVKVLHPSWHARMGQTQVMKKLGVYAQPKKKLSGTVLHK